MGFKRRIVHVEALLHNIKWKAMEPVIKRFHWVVIIIKVLAIDIRKHITGFSIGK